MKKLTVHQLVACTLSLLVLLPLTDVRAAEGDFIRQKQLDSLGMTLDYYVPSDTGTAPSWLPISEMGAEFSLYAKGIASDEKTYFLDSKIVGAYLPQADVTIFSEDPYRPLRTRADRPFKVVLTASGMLDEDDSAAMPHQKEVFFRRVYEVYDPATHASPAGTETIQVEVEAFGMTNGSLERTQLTSLPVGADGDPTKVEGEEVFTIFSTPDTTVPAYSVLDSEVIKIWPVATGVIDGIVEGQRVLRNLPLVTQKLVDLYPNSLTYLQIYSGPQVDGTRGTVIAESMIPIYQDVPQDKDLPVSLENYCQEDGIYTLELVTVTPFNDGAPEILDTVTFEVDRTIIVRAHVGGSE